MIRKVQLASMCLLLTAAFAPACTVTLEEAEEEMTDDETDDETEATEESESEDSDGEDTEAEDTEADEEDSDDETEATEGAGSDAEGGEEDEGDEEDSDDEPGEDEDGYGEDDEPEMTWDGDGGAPMDETDEDAGPVEPEPPAVEEVDTIGVGVGGDTFCSDGSFTVTIQPKDADGKLVTPSVDDLQCMAAIADEPVECSVEDVECDLGGDADTGKTAVLVIVDDSNSMNTNDGDGLRKVACAEFVQQLADDDAVAVVDFGNGGTSPATALRTVQAFTTDKALAVAACESLGTGPRGTPIYGSVVDAAQVFLPAAQEEFGDTTSFSVLMLSDGEPDADTADRDDALLALEEAKFPIYTVGLGPAAEGSDEPSPEAVETLQELSQVSGGAYASSVAPEGLSGLFEQVGSVVREGSCEVSARLLAGSFTSGDEISGQLTFLGGEVGTEFGFNVPTTDLEESICD